VEDKTEVMQHVLKCGKFPSCLNMLNEYLGEFFYMNTGL